MFLGQLEMGYESVLLRHLDFSYFSTTQLLVSIFADLAVYRSTRSDNKSKIKEH